MVFIGGGGETCVFNKKKLAARIIAPDRRSHDGKYVVRIRREWGNQEWWLTVPRRFEDERAARLFVMRHWLRIYKVREGA